MRASAARHGHQALDPVGKQGKWSKGVSPSRCYAPRRVHTPHAGRIGPPPMSAGRSAGRCPAAPPAPGPPLSGRQILVVGKMEKRLTQPCGAAFTPSCIYLEHARTYFTHTHGIHFWDKANNEGNKPSFLKCTDAVHTNKRTHTFQARFKKKKIIISVMRWRHARTWLFFYFHPLILKSFGLTNNNNSSNEHYFLTTKIATLT